ncbi:MAG: YicC/YloC family endoribonuclease [Victivallaceae bacterium]
MKSMTGFGKGDAVDAANGLYFSVEISSVNRKQLEIRASLPREITMFEPLLRQLISGKISRGALSVKVNMSVESASGLETMKVNRPLLEKLAGDCAKVQQLLGQSTEVSVATLMTIPGVLEAVQPDIERPEFINTFSAAVSKAVDALNAMRDYEGNSLKTDFMERLNILETIVQGIEPQAAQIPGLLKQKLLERLARENLPVSADDERVLKEIVIYVDKSDVSEEITRLKSHFSHFATFLENDAEPVGRSMDFLVQEMFREITTLGNKAGGCEITAQIVKFKTDLEKIREQIQNVE